MVKAVVVVVEGVVATAAEGEDVLLTDIAEQERRLCFNSWIYRLCEAQSLP